MNLSMFGFIKALKISYIQKPDSLGIPKVNLVKKRNGDAFYVVSSLSLPFTVFQCLRIE